MKTIHFFFSYATWVANVGGVPTTSLEPRQGHDMGNMGGKDVGEMASMGGGKMGGMGGIGAIDLSNPYISQMISTMLDWGTGLLPKMSLNKTEDLPPRIKQLGARRTRFFYGPLSIENLDYKKKYPNYLGLDPQGSSFYAQADRFPTDISILAAQTFVSKADGTPTTIKDQLYNHHVVLADANKPPPKILACPGAIAGASMPLSQFVSAGQEGGVSKFVAADENLKTGYYVGKNHRVYLTTEIVNYSPNVTQSVFVLVDLEYLNGKNGLDTTQESISVTQCDGTGTGIKPAAGQKKFTTTSKPMTIQMDGYIFALRGHLHDGGTSLQVSINNATVCESKAEYAGKNGGALWDTIREMTECAKPIEVKKGDQLSLQSSYDLEKHPARGHAGGGEAEEMGIANMQFARLGE